MWDRHNAEVDEVVAEIEAGERGELGEEFVEWTRSAAVEVGEVSQDYLVIRAADALVEAIDDGDPWMSDGGAWMALDVQCAVG